MSLDAKFAQFAAETKPPPYLIRESTLERTLERLREIEPSKRRIIIYAGVHPNEGTDKLAAKYATQWAEKYGATVVCQPSEDTPHALWARHGKEVGGDTSVPLPADMLLDEEGYANKFALGDRDTFIVRFHGTPLSFVRDRARPGLTVTTSRYASHPEDFQDRPHAAEFGNPKITEGLEEILTSSLDVENHVKEENGQEDPQFIENTPNMLLVEYYYEDQPVSVEDLYVRELLKKEAEAERTGGVFPLSQESWQRQMKMGLEYIEQPTPSEKGISDFDTTVVKDFERVLELISSRLLEKGGQG